MGIGMGYDPKLCSPGLKSHISAPGTLSWRVKRASLHNVSQRWYFDTIVRPRCAKSMKILGIPASFCILALLELAQGLTSAICKVWVPISPKKQEFGGEHISNAANKKSKIKYSKIVGLFEQVFSLLAVHEYFHDGFWKPRKSAQKVIYF